jgi:hypothetical protein
MPLASGSFGSLKIMFDFNQGAMAIIGSRQNYTAYSPDGTGVPNDTVFDIGLGTAAIAAAADGVLTASATYDNIGAKIDQTLSAAPQPAPALISLLLLWTAPRPLLIW